MTIITDKTEMSLKQSDKCSFCGGLLFFPYLEWHASPEDHDKPTNIICVCERCCSKNGEGLRADLIQIQAIAELKNLYPDFTLIRTTYARREREHKEREIEDYRRSRNLKVRR